MKWYRPLPRIAHHFIKAKALLPPLAIIAQADEHFCLHHDSLDYNALIECKQDHFSFNSGTKRIYLFLLTLSI
ncbi:hypothetical protein PanWU01x14_014920 [Parasponia andersonii]|uniref:Uncharacterized protein n=1 Tax=Parasponia andersonii TaxID=3476 RepID=A0A2P5E0C1_PARAD|nr:hypothetical protein PanWU01x14_014920 [Parasponia andersonii]